MAFLQSFSLFVFSQVCLESKYNNNSIRGLLLVSYPKPLLLAFSVIVLAFAIWERPELAWPWKETFSGVELIFLTLGLELVKEKSEAVQLILRPEAGACDLVT